MIAGHLVDLSPLRASRPFRVLWVSSAVSVLGSQIGSFAVLLYVWQLTHDPFWTGGAALVRAVPTVVFALAGGSLADATDRRRLVLVTAVGQLITATLMAALVLADLGRLWPVLGLLAVQSAFAAAGAPARRSFVVRLLPAHQVGAGVALTMGAWQVAGLVGPALGGVLAGLAGLRVCFAVDAATYLVAMWGIWSLPAMPPQSREHPPGLASVLAGFAFVTARPVLAGAFLSDVAAMVLAMPIALFPAVSAQRYGGQPQVVGAFMSAVAAGGLLATGFSGRFSAARRPGAAMLAAATTWGLALTVFGLTSRLWLALTALAVAGVADSLAVLSRTTIVQLATPDAYRGRVGAIDHVVGLGGPELGNFRGGLVASLTSTGLALVSGGLLSVVGILAVSALFPALRRFGGQDAAEPAVPAG